ncbi:hypothetical protein M5G20_26010 [Pseudomonas sp. TNT2022 ID1044]|uniref:hypothetical protein n=1 Tax=Pseudomonas sp. TNT2022 ID1044 TaxID=2942636 RepID=UPI00235E5C5A|nr:hypothetical protein [Pseudomonas sp. TNT2022 ID1044]MDD0999298.1 hypothetical protein [Pseudomonas sp. TNT2022 ID1044]
MPSWFQEHPAFSIISHTIVVATATWLVSSFVIDENKVNLYKAKAESAESRAEQFNAKISILESDLANLKSENDRYLTWLTSDPKTVPAMEKRIKELEGSLASAALNKVSEHHEGSDQPLVKPKYYEFSKSFMKGETFVDPKTNAVIGISNISIDNTARGTLYIPGSETIELQNVGPGATWKFDKNGVKYQMTVEGVNWLNNTLKASVTEVDKE